MDTNHKKLYDIVDGPSRSALFDSCEYIHDKHVTFPLTFKVMGYDSRYIGPESGYGPIKARNFRVCGIEHKDGAGDNFMIKGHFETEVYLERQPLPVWRPRYFEGCYNTKTRKGIIGVE